MSVPPAERSLRPLVVAAMGCVFVLVASQVAFRAVRDTLFLSRFPASALPPMIAAGAIVSIVTAFAATRELTAIGPRRFLPRALVVGAVLTVVAWALVRVAPGAGAVFVWLHVAALAPVVLSGFWALVNECFDPRSAKKALGRVAAAGTLGGLAGGIAAERWSAGFGVEATLPVLAVAQAWGAWTTGRLDWPGGGAARPGESADEPPTRESYRRLAATPYLRNLALLVLGGSLGAAILDFVFKVELAAAAASEQDLMRGFSFFYAGVALLTFALQAWLARPALEKGGLAPTIGTLPGAVIAGSTLAAIVPGPWTVGIARGLEAVLHNSLFRAGYELLYTPVPPAEKRATRILIDVGCDRLGDLGGAALLALVLALVPGPATPFLLVLAAGLAVATLGVVVRVQRGYVASLEAGLRAGALRLDPAAVEDRTTWITLQTTLVLPPLAPGAAGPPAAPAPAGAPAAAPDVPAVPDPATGEGAQAAIARLADDRLARRAAEALEPVAELHLPLLAAALLDPATPFPARRRIPAILARTPTPRAADALARGLADARFEVRYRCGRALSRLVDANPALWVDGDRIVAAARRECELGRQVWESQRLLDQLDEPVEDAFVDRFLRERAGRSLEHVFTLLALVLEREPLQIAFRGLHSGDRLLRGTALEYLDVVLPPSIHAVLWPHLEPAATRRSAAPAPPRDREQVLADLLHSNRSIELSLEALRRERSPGA